MPLYRPDALEIAGGWVHGFVDTPAPSNPEPDPRRVLDRLLLPHLARYPCFVAFSGGRDSSALLAAAVTLARRAGVALPVPITIRYPDAQATDEADWQERVLRHLGVTDRVLLTAGGEHDAIGPVVTPLLERHGLLWPPNLAPTWQLMDRARGGALLTGENGDEVFGLKRITPLTRLLKTRGRTDRRVFPHAVLALAPPALRRRVALRGRYRRFWLRPPVEELLARRDAADAVSFALHAGRNAWQFATRRCVRLGCDTVRLLGAEIGAEYVQPFGEPDFVASVAATSGFWGWTGRTAAMRHLFGDLLPREVLERGTKAHFIDAVFTARTREFARGWDGTGVDADLADPEILRENWLSATPHAPTMSLLQQAWLASMARRPA